MFHLQGNVFDFDQFKDDLDVRKKAYLAAAEGGPNSGFEIQDKDYFTDPAITGQFPELRDDVELLISVESYVAKLYEFKDRIAESKGFNRGMSYELMELIPSNENFTNPLRFTEEISRNGYEPSLEALSAKVWAMIAAATAFLLALIYKFIRWITGDKTEEAGIKSVEEIGANIHRANDCIVKQEEVFEEIGGLIDSAEDWNTVPLEPTNYARKELELGGHDQVMERHLKERASRASLDNKLNVDGSLFVQQATLSEVLLGLPEAKRLRKMIDSPSQITRVIFNGNKDVMEMVADCFVGMEAATLPVTLQVQRLEDICNDIAQATGDGADANWASINMKLKTLDNDVKNTPLFRGTKVKFKHPADMITTLNNLIDKGAKSTFAFDGIGDFVKKYQRTLFVFRQIDYGGLGPFILALPASSETMKRANKISTTFASASSMDGPDNIDTRLLTSVTTAVARNFSSMMRIYQVLMRIQHDVHKTGGGLIQILQDNAGRIRHQYKKHHAEPPAPIIAYANKLDFNSAKFFGADPNMYLHTTLLDPDDEW